MELKVEREGKWSLRWRERGEVELKVEGERGSGA